MGAKLTADFYRTGRISHTEALWLLCFSSQLSPAFLISFVAYNGFSDPFLQRFFLTSYYMSLGLYMLLLRLFFHCFKSSQSAAVTTKKEVSQLPTTPEDLDTSITYSLNAITRLGGYILLFTIAADGLKKLSPLPPKINCLVLGVIEITTGLQQIYSHTWPLLFKAILMSSCCAFGGLCGMMQVQSVLTGSGLPLSVYTIAKVTQALIAAACYRWIIPLLRTLNLRQRLLYSGSEPPVVPAHCGFSLQRHSNSLRNLQIHCTFHRRH